VLQVIGATTLHASQIVLFPPNPCSIGGQIVLLLVASGPIQTGPCLPLAPNCIQFTVTPGGFQVQGIEAGGLQPGDLLTLIVPVVDATGAARGFREVPCAPADASGQATCNAVVNAPGLSPQVGGTKQAVVNRQPVPLIPPPPLVLPPPPPPFLVPVQPAAPAMIAGEVPVVPETDSLALLVGGLAALTVFVGLRRLRRGRE
jgi:hypothetical protein